MSYVIRCTSGLVLLAALLVLSPSLVSAGPQNGEVNHIKIDSFSHVIGPHEYLHALNLVFYDLDQSIDDWTAAYVQQWLVANRPEDALDWGVEVHVHSDGSVTIVATLPNGSEIIFSPGPGPFLPMPETNLMVQTVSITAVFVAPR